MLLTSSCSIKFPSATRRLAFVSKVRMGGTFMMSDGGSSYFPANTVYFGDILYLLWQVDSEEFSCHCCRHWAKVFVICVQVHFYELIPSIIKLGICMCQKRKAVYCLLGEHFPAIYLINLFQDGVSDASKSCHALNDRRLHFLEFQVLQPDGGAVVIPNQTRTFVKPSQFSGCGYLFILSHSVKTIFPPSYLGLSCEGFDSLLLCKSPWWPPYTHTSQGFVSWSMTRPSGKNLVP